ncbi:MAG: ATP-binding cassette domain-containing protein [Burkholderiales bacterium]|nr:ATP-binding cassette domain-containing protein [Burkholderiales bacterium]
MTEASSSSAPCILEVEQVCLHFGGLRVLRDVGFRVKAGEVVGLIGPNGAGKSALMNCITGLYQPDPSARISVNGVRIDHLPAHERGACRLSRTFQHANLIPGLSVTDNVMIGLASCQPPRLLRQIFRPWGSRAAESAARERARHMIARCGLEAHADQAVDDLPLGLRRRVDLARALVSEPLALLLDEPASGMSHQERALIPELIAIAQRECNVGTVWIEHDLDLIVSTAQRVIVMHHGEAIFDADGLHDPAVRSAAIDAYMKGTLT